MSLDISKPLEYINWSELQCQQSLAESYRSVQADTQQQMHHSGELKVEDMYKYMVNVKEEKKVWQLGDAWNLKN